MQEILTKFKFRDQIQTLVEADILGHLISDFLNPEVNLSPKDVLDEDGRVRLPKLDNHSMGTVFEELIRRFNEENNEEAGERNPARRCKPDGQAAVSFRKKSSDNPERSARKPSATDSKAWRPKGVREASRVQRELPYSTRRPQPKPRYY